MFQSEHRLPRGRDRVAEGESLAVIETEKIDTDLPSPADGTLIELLYPEGTTVSVGTVIARIEG